eukprot:scpid68914/ scgid6739/ 
MSCLLANGCQQVVVHVQSVLRLRPMRLNTSSSVTGARSRSTGAGACTQIRRTVPTPQPQLYGSHGYQLELLVGDRWPIARAQSSALWLANAVEHFLRQAFGLGAQVGCFVQGTLQTLHSLSFCLLGPWRQRVHQDRPVGSSAARSVPRFLHRLQQDFQVITSLLIILLRPCQAIDIHGSVDRRIGTLRFLQHCHCRPVWPGGRLADDSALLCRFGDPHCGQSGTGNALNGRTNKYAPCNSSSTNSNSDSVKELYCVQLVKY